MSDAINTGIGLLTSAGTPLDGFSGSIDEAAAAVDNSQRPLTTREFEAMMREFDEAQDWMLDQLRQRWIAQKPLTCR